MCRSGLPTGVPKAAPARQIIADISLLAVNKKSSDELKTTSLTSPACGRCSSTKPVSTSQSRASFSVAVARRRPSRVSTARNTRPGCFNHPDIGVCGSCVPDSRGFVVRGRRDSVAICAEAHPSQTTAVFQTLGSLGPVSRDGIPDADGVVRAWEKYGGSIRGHDLLFIDEVGHAAFGGNLPRWSRRPR